MLPVIFVDIGGILIVWLLSFGFVERLLSCFSRMYFPSLCLSFPSIIPCKVGFVERYCVNLVLSCNTLVSPSVVIENFAGYRSLGWHL